MGRQFFKNVDFSVTYPLNGGDDGYESIMKMVRIMIDDDNDCNLKDDNDYNYLPPKQNFAGRYGFVGFGFCLCLFDS